MDISKQLHAYEVEYHVLQDELQESSYACEDSEPVEKLERANNQLKRQNMDLLEKLQVKTESFDKKKNPKLLPPKKKQTTWMPPACTELYWTNRDVTWIEPLLTMGHSVSDYVKVLWGCKCTYQLKYHLREEMYTYKRVKCQLKVESG